MAKKASPKAKVKVKVKPKAKPAAKKPAKAAAKAAPAKKAAKPKPVAKKATASTSKSASKKKAKVAAKPKAVAKEKDTEAPKGQSKNARIETQRSEMQVALMEYPDLGSTVIDGQRALSFPMQILEKHFEAVKITQEHNRAEYACTLVRMEANGNWQDLGYTNASEYFDKKHAIAYSTIKTHVNALRLLG